MDNTIIAALIGVCGGLVGAWIGGVISRKASIEAVESSNKNAIDIMRRQQFNNAAATFRSAFTVELRELKNTIEYNKEISEEYIIQLLTDTAVKFENACINFRPYLDEIKRISFNNAWSNYCHPQGGNPKQMPGPFIEYFIDRSDHDALLLIIKNIENLLNFAELK